MIATDCFLRGKDAGHPARDLFARCDGLWNQVSPLGCCSLEHYGLFNIAVDAEQLSGEGINSSAQLNVGGLCYWHELLTVHSSNANVHDGVVAHIAIGNRQPELNGGAWLLTLRRKTRYRVLCDFFGAPVICILADDSQPSLQAVDDRCHIHDAKNKAADAEPVCKSQWFFPQSYSLRPANLNRSGSLRQSSEEPRA